VRGVASSIQVIVSNTADRGYLLDAEDSAALLHDGSRAPRSFPAKLLALLHRRWLQAPEAPPSIFPCELLERNGPARAAAESVSGAPRRRHRPEPWPKEEATLRADRLAGRATRSDAGAAAVARSAGR
jgi:hypothetical protein